MHRATSLSASPLVLCSVTGLLIGIALLVVLPQSVESLIAQGWAAENIFSLFLAAPMAVFFVEHVVIVHEHGHPELDADGRPHVHDENCGHGPPSIPHAVTFNADGSRTPVGKVSERSGLINGKKPASELDRWFEWWGLVLRLGAWVLHALLDGVLLGTTDTLSVLVPLAFAILICGIQDTAGLYIFFTARSCSPRFVAVAVASFGCAFPLGAAVGLVAFHDMHTRTSLLSVLRCVMAGLFVYMALFELAPPHAHGRLNNLKYFLAFSFGLLSAYVADLFEDKMHSHQQEESRPDIFSAGRSRTFLF